jgi:hypothetical protein
MKENEVELKNKRKILLAPVPKKSLNSLSTVFVAVGGEVVAVGARELDPPRPQGSDRLSERPVSLLAVVRSSVLHGIACAFDAVEGCHGSFDTVLAEVRSFVSNAHGSPMKKSINSIFKNKKQKLSNVNK